MSESESHAFSSYDTDCPTWRTLKGALERSISTVNGRWKFPGWRYRGAQGKGRLSSDLPSVAQVLASSQLRGEDLSSWN